jgi:hypothetical protein
MTRGLKLNNPLNIERVAGQTWIGQTYEQPDATFVNFVSPQYCYRAAARIVMRHYQPGKTLVQNVVAAWSPATAGNPVAAYVANVEQWMGHRGPLDLPAQLPELFHAMTRQEQGYCPYDDAVILEGLALDGVEPHPAEAPPPVAIPVPAPVDLPPAETPEPFEDPPVVALPAPTPPPVDAPNPFVPSQSTTSSLGLGAAASVLLVWVLDQFHLHMDPEQAMAAGVVISTLAGYFAKGGRAIHTQGTAA